MIVWGLDLSLALTGLSVVDTTAKTIHLNTVASKPCARVPHPTQTRRGKPVMVVPEFTMATRLAAIADAIFDALLDGTPPEPVDLAVIEALPPHLPGGGHHERAGLFWTVAAELARRGIPVAAVWPASRAMYATGNGGADKLSVVASTVQTYQLEDVSDDNMIDALLLAAMGCRHLGEPIEPSALTEKQASAVSGVVWPEERP